VREAVAVGQPAVVAFLRTRRRIANQRASVDAVLADGGVEVVPTAQRGGVWSAVALTTRALQAMAVDAVARRAVVGNLARMFWQRTKVARFGSVTAPSARGYGQEAEHQRNCHEEVSARDENHRAGPFSKYCAL